MKKMLNVLLVIGMVITMFSGCEDIADSPIGSGTMEVDLDTPYNLYWVDLPTGKAYPEGYHEYEYSCISAYYSTEAGVTPIESDYLDKIFTTQGGQYATYFRHWTESREYYTDKFYYVLEGQSYVSESSDQYHECEVYNEAPRKLMLLSAYTLNHEIYEFEFLDTELTNLAYRMSEPSIDNLQSAPDGGFLAFISDLTAKKVYFVRWDKDGKRITTLPHDEFRSFWPYISSSSTYEDIQKTVLSCDYVIAQNGNIYFLVDDKVMVMSSEGEHLYTVDVPQSALGVSYDLTLDKDDNAILQYTARVNGVGNDVYSPLDDASQRFGDMVALGENIVGVIPQFAPGYDAYWATPNGVLAANAGGEKETLISWINYDLTADMIESASVVDVDHFFIEVRDPDTDERRFGLLTTADIEEHEPQTLSSSKQTLSLAYVVSSNARTAKTIEQYVTDFNRTNDEYRVVLVPYTADGELTANYKLVKEMLSGKVPDMILFDSDMGPEAFARLNTFRNLYDFMDGDSQYGRDEFLPCVLKPFENSKGELPYLTIQFGISTISAKKSSMNGRQSWTIKELAEYAASLDNDQYLMDITGSTQTGDAAMLLRVLLPSTLNSYVDYETGTCYFGDSLASLLELCKTASVSRSSNGVAATMYTNNTILTRPFNNMDSVQDFLANRYCYFSGDALTYLGFPTEEDCGTVIVPMTSIAITNQCENVEGAWTFIKFCLGSQQSEWIYDSTCTNINVEGGFPCTRSTAELMLKTLKHYYFYSIVMQSPSNPDALMVGGSIGGIHFAEDGGYQDGDKNKVNSVGTTLYSVTDEDAEDLMMLFESITMVRSYDTELLSIIYEDAAYYFADTKSLDETVKIINNRVKTRLNE